MIKLNDYLYSGHTVLSILKLYSDDLRNHAKEDHNTVDLIHCNFLLQLTELLEHNDFLTSQSQRVNEFYKYMATEYPYLAFIFRGRIKSLIRAEEKFNGYISSYIYNYYISKGSFPTFPEIEDQVNHFRDLIAYRIVISYPTCNLKPGQSKHDIEINLLYEIANKLPEFMEERGFTAVLAESSELPPSTRLGPSINPYYKDYIENATASGYQSLHINFYDNIARSYIEVQLRTKDMDDHAEIGDANHFGYEASQAVERAKRDALPEGLNKFFDDAYSRCIALQQMDISKLDVNMFSAVDNHLINDCCGLLKGRLILPFEHLSRYQND